MPQGEQVHTVSACYADRSVDEKPFMDAVVERTAAHPHFIYPRAEDVFAQASNITWHQDEPFGSTSIFAQWSVFAEARRAGIKVMLDGQGADEQLAGYHFAFPYYLATCLRKGKVAHVLRTLWSRRNLHGATFAHQTARLVSVMLPASKAQAIRRQRENRLQNGWLDSNLLQKHGNPEGALATAAGGIGMVTPRNLGELCQLMTYASNLPMLLHWEDRNSMAHAIEARVPFLDGPLVDFSLALGNTHKMAGAETKRVLRRAMSDVLPRSVSTRQDKLGFATPESAWFKGPLRSLMHDGVEKTLQLYPDVLNPAGVRKLRDEMLAGNRPMDSSLWRIVNLGIWGERFNVGI